MKYITLLRNSIYSPEFYRKLLEEKFSFSLKYFYRLILIMALVMMILFSFEIIPRIYTFARVLPPTLEDIFPEDLVVTIDKGIASINLPEPYIFPTPSSWIETVQRTSQGKELQYVLVIDTRENFTVEGFDEYKSFVVLKRDALVIKDRGGLRIQKLQDAPDIVFNRQKAQAYAGQLRIVIDALQKWIVPIVVFGLFVGFFVVLHFTLVYLFFGALLVWVIARMRNLKIGYKKAYQIGLHGVTLGILFGASSFLFGGVRIPFIFTLLFILVIAMNLKGRDMTLLTEEVQEPVPIA